MELVLLWGACSIICAALASRSGRDTTAWFFLGLIFGLFAVLAILLLPKKLPRDQKTCPMCAEAVKSEALVCRFCGHEFLDAPSTSKSRSASPTELSAAMAKLAAEREAKSAARRPTAGNG